jgi:ketosteroid isomerase-like protein
MTRPTLPRNTILAACCALTLAGCATTRTVPVPDPAQVQAEIRSALQRFDEATARGDVAGALAQFDAQADILLVGSDKGEVYKGRAEMERWLGALMKRSGFSWQMDRVEIGANGDTGWAFVEGAMKVNDLKGGQRGSTPYRFTAVLVRRGDGWAWRLFHGSVPVGH